MDLKTYLESRRMSHKEFAKLIGVNPCSVSNYICKKRKPSLEIAIEIEKKTNGKVTVMDLYKWWEGDCNEIRKVKVPRKDDY